jgi:hypothetical protein
MGKGKKESQKAKVKSQKFGDANSVRAERFCGGVEVTSRRYSRNESTFDF